MSNGSLREVMPVTAGLIDELRRAWDREAVDALVRRSMQGQGSLANGNLHAVEVGPDGVKRTFGRAIVDRNGSSRALPHAGNSSLPCGLLRGGSKGVVS